MITIKEFLLSKTNNVTPMIKATDKNIKELVKKEISIQSANGNLINLNHIDTSKVTEMSDLFWGYTLDFEVSEWDVSHVTNMNHMFAGCSNFNCDISAWKVSELTNAKSMFSGCEHFNCDIGDWKLDKLFNADFMFNFCVNFDQDLSKWNVSKIQYANSMFCHCHKFNHNVGNFNFYNLENLDGLFSYCRAFDQDVSNLLNGKKKQSINSIFAECDEFTGNGLENWNTGSIYSADKAFYKCKKLSADLSQWDVSELKAAESMFEECESLTCDFSGWRMHKHVFFFPQNVKKMFYKSSVKKQFRAPIP